MVSELTHPVLGRVVLRHNSRARNFTARWKNGELHLTVPDGTTQAETRRALDTMAPRLMSRKPATFSFQAGLRMEFDGTALAVEAIDRPGLIGSRIDGRTMYLRLSADIDTSLPDAQNLIARHIRRMAEFVAPSILLPRAREIAAGIGVHPAEWSVGRGSRRLGCCGSDRRISLSCFCIFLPRRLRDYIVCHELAHLTHFDHSPQFHALCSRYCGGDGDVRRAELKAFKWPVPRL